MSRSVQDFTHPGRPRGRAYHILHISAGPADVRTLFYTFRQTRSTRVPHFTHSARLGRRAYHILHISAGPADVRTTFYTFRQAPRTCVPYFTHSGRPGVRAYHLLHISEWQLNRRNNFEYMESLAKQEKLICVYGSALKLDVIIFVISQQHIFELKNRIKIQLILKSP